MGAPFRALASLAMPSQILFSHTKTYFIYFDTLFYKINFLTLDNSPLEGVLVLHWDLNVSK